MGAETCEKCGRPKDTEVGPNDGACFRESLGADDDCRIFAAEARADAAERERDAERATIATLREEVERLEAPHPQEPEGSSK